MRRSRKQPNITTASPFPVERLEDFYTWCQSSKSLLRQMAKEEFLAFFAEVLRRGAYSVGIYGDGELGGVFICEPSDWAGDTPTDVTIAMCLARRLWGYGVMERVSVPVLNALFTQHPHLQSITANVVGTNYPEKRLIESVGFRYEQTSKGAVTLGETAYDVNLYRLTREDFYGMLQRS